MYSPEMYARAMDFAVHRHNTQLYGKYPYVVHLYAVAAVLFNFGITPATEDGRMLLSGCWLHDLLEDTDVTKNELEDLFGKHIAEMVFCVTDGDGDIREEKKESVYKKLSGNEDACAIKLADRIANVEACILLNNTRKLNVYMQENEKLLSSIKTAARPVLIGQMKAYLQTILANAVA
ncbi:MAG: HD domain-containing protein [Chitinophagaceae bacterium]